MKYILASRHLRELSHLARQRALVAFDFDGTLAPIVDDRDVARMRRSTARLFERVCAAFPCAVVSGRRRDDVAARLGGAAVRYVVGEHGADDGISEVPGWRAIAAVLGRVRRALGGWEGVDIEVKRASLAIHYRNAADPGAARRAVDAALARLPARLRLVPGKCVVNVVSEDAPNKGDALRRLMRVERAERALYVGDDDTDEDVFRLTGPRRPLTVRVGRSAGSRADYYLRNQREIDLLLRAIAAAPATGRQDETPRR
jgi:trehalose 6-phosphate phosphatase